MWVERWKRAQTHKKEWNFTNCIIKKFVSLFCSRAQSFSCVSLTLFADATVLLLGWCFAVSFLLWYHHDKPGVRSYKKEIFSKAAKSWMFVAVFCILMKWVFIRVLAAKLSRKKFSSMLFTVFTSSIVQWGMNTMRFPKQW